MKTKLTYDDIKLGGKVKMPNCNNIGEITCIDNFASLAGINEPIFYVKNGMLKYYFGLKYILKNYIQE